MQATGVFATAGLDGRSIGKITLINFCYQGDGSHSAKQCIFNK
jgi:hypothetical protein